MASGPTDLQRDLGALHNMIEEAHSMLDIESPQGRAKAAREKLSTALALSESLLATSPAASLGARGGSKTAERGPEYFKRISGMRKTQAGGRPKKDA